MKQLLFSVFFLLATDAAAQDTIPGFDRDAWISDSLGCAGVRHKLVRKITAAQAQLIGKTPEGIEQLLGPPNGDGWYYFDEDGPQCAWGSLEAIGWLLTVEYDANGLVSRIGIIIAD
jgi:hypothetical protein